MEKTEKNRLSTGISLKKQKILGRDLAWSLHLMLPSLTSDFEKISYQTGAIEKLNSKG